MDALHNQAKLEELFLLIQKQWEQKKGQHQRLANKMQQQLQDTNAKLEDQIDRANLADQQIQQANEQHREQIQTLKAQHSDHLQDIQKQAREKEEAQKQQILDLTRKVDEMNSSQTSQAREAENIESFRAAAKDADLRLESLQSEAKKMQARFDEALKQAEARNGEALQEAEASICHLRDENATQAKALSLAASRERERGAIEQGLQQEIAALKLELDREKQSLIHVSGVKDELESLKADNLSALSAASSREDVLSSQISDLEANLANSRSELVSISTLNQQLQRQLEVYRTVNPDATSENKHAVIQSCDMHTAIADAVAAEKASAESRSRAAVQAALKAASAKHTAALDEAKREIEALRSGHVQQQAESVASTVAEAAVEELTLLRERLLKAEAATATAKSAAARAVEERSAALQNLIDSEEAAAAREAGLNAELMALRDSNNLSISEHARNGGSDVLGKKGWSKGISIGKSVAAMGGRASSAFSRKV